VPFEREAFRDNLHQYCRNATQKLMDTGTLFNFHLMLLGIASKTYGGASVKIGMTQKDVLVCAYDPPGVRLVVIRYYLLSCGKHDRNLAFVVYRMPSKPGL